MNSPTHSVQSRSCQMPYPISANLWHPSFLLSRSNPFLPLPHPAELGSGWPLMNSSFTSVGFADRCNESGPDTDMANNNNNGNPYLSFLKLNIPTRSSSPSSTQVSDSTGPKNLTCPTREADKLDAESADEVLPKVTRNSVSPHCPVSSQRNQRIPVEPDPVLSKKFATRETTGLLKTWLNQHRRNPYPTKGEKLMLALITRMNLTQISTWFANARRRLKKENQMTWVPKVRHYNPGDLHPNRRFYHHHQHHHQQLEKIRSGKSHEQNSDHSAKMETQVNPDLTQSEVLNLTNRCSSWSSPDFGGLSDCSRNQDSDFSLSHFEFISKHCSKSPSSLEASNYNAKDGWVREDGNKKDRLGSDLVKNESVQCTTASKIWSVADVIESR